MKTLNRETIKKILKYLIGFFKIGEELSAMRLIFIIISIVNIIMYCIIVLKRITDPTSAASAFGIIEGVLLGSKLVQNKQENQI